MTERKTEMDYIIRKITQDDKRVFIEMSREFYGSSAVLNNIDDAFHFNTFEELMRSDVYLECYIFETDKGEIAAFFKAAAQNIRRGGVLAFDVNTPYKHKNVLGVNTFVYDAEGAFCAWQNTFSPEDCSVDIELDLFFENEDGTWERSYESFREIALPQSELCGMLETAGFEVLCVYDYLTKNEPTENSEKLMIAARRK